MKNYTRRDFINQAAVLGMAGVGVSALSSLLGGCVGTDLASTVSQVSEYASSFQKGAEAVQKSMEDFTPEQEYYIGRTIAAVVLSKYKPYRVNRTNHYVNLMGQTLAEASDMPEVFNGYHLLVLDSNDVNAFATPSGLIFVTRGMLCCCNNEGELAAVLAHEVGHVQKKHGLQSIKKGRVAEAVSILAIEGTKQFGSDNLASLTENFEDSINDIATTMINNGYSRAFEEEADESAVTILKRVGYNPSSLIEMLKVMDTKLKPGGLDFAKTHPSPKSRIEYISDLGVADKKPARSPAREKRFAAAMNHV